MKPIYFDLGFGITCIDTRHMRDDFVAAYLIEDNGCVAFVDTGYANHTSTQFRGIN
jgi:hypothetical protein